MSLTGPLFVHQTHAGAAAELPPPSVDRVRVIRRSVRCFLFGLVLVLGWHKLEFWDGFGFAAAMLVEFLWFIGNLCSLTWFGLYAGLKHSNHAKALGRTIFDIILLPWLLMGIVLAIIGIATMGQIDVGSWVTPVSVCDFAVALAVCNLGFAGWAVSELRDRFRPLAARQPMPEGFFPRWVARLQKPALWRRKQRPQTA